MASKCNSCGKFLSTTDGIKCARCSNCFHRKCIINVSPDSKRPKWICKECKPKYCTPSKQKESTSEYLATEQIESDSPPYMNARTLGDAHLLSSLREDIQALRLELATVTREISTFRQEIVSLRNTVSEVGTRVDIIEERITVLEEKTTLLSNCDLVQDIERLKLDINARDQALLLNDVEVVRITELKDENLHHIIRLTASKIGVKLDDRDIVFVKRKGQKQTHSDTSKQSQPRPIIIRVSRRALRDELLRAARAHRGADTSGIIINEEPKRFYLNERLTGLNRHIFFRAREEGRLQGWKYIWVRNGQIFVRRDKDVVTQRILTENDISKIIC